MQSAVAIVATANINNLGLSAAMGRSGCSASKGSGSNQDPKRTDSSSGQTLDDGAEPITPFEASLRSTIKDQESTHSQVQSARGKSSENTHAAGHHRPTTKLDVSSIPQKPVTGKTASNSTSKNEATQNQQPDAEQSALTAIDPNAVAAVSGATLTSLVAVLQFGGSADGGSPLPADDSSAVSAAVADSKSGAMNTATVAASVNLDSQIQGLKGDQDTLVFDGTLHPAAPGQPQTALAGAGKPAWLLNAQPVYTAAGLANKAVDGPGPPDGATDTRASNPGTPMAAGIPQAAAPLPSLNFQSVGSAPGDNAKSDATQSQSAKAAAGQTTEGAAVNNSQQKPASGSAQGNSAPLILAEQSGQASSGQSLSGNASSGNASSGNASDFEKDAKHGASGPEVAHSPEIAANGSQIFPTSDSGTKGIDTAAQPNNAAPASSKPGNLPIDQQAETRQPSMKTDLNMRIQGQSGESINLRISERAGDIQISVRSSDQSTANVLKHELPSIEAGLERAGWRMENGGMSQSGQDQHEAGRDSQNPDRNRDQNAQSSNWQDRNQRRKDSSPNAWFELDQ
jgi:hypothetical protein